MSDDVALWEQELAGVEDAAVRSWRVWWWTWRIGITAALGGSFATGWWWP